VRAVGAQERRLVNAELAHTTDAVRVVDEWRAVLDHRVHHRRPTHAELGCHLRDRSSMLTDLAARFHPGAAGDDALRVEVA
jgi:hypothetical protein